MTKKTIKLNNPEFVLRQQNGYMVLEFDDETKSVADLVAKHRPKQTKK